jgi:DNA-binding transcriptional MocR family regulator
MTTKNGHCPQWDVKLSRGAGSPLYVQLADAVERAIETGALVSGDRLPPHHNLARDLDVNITTITKAFSVLKEKGLVDSRPGRGTIVRPQQNDAEVQFQTAASESGSVIDLSVNRPASSAYTTHLSKLLPALPQDERFPSLKDYQNPEGPVWARDAGVQWISEFGPPVERERVLVTDGAQHALACTLSAVTSVGDCVLADNVTYQGINALCRAQHLELRGVAGDAQGMSPEALEAACREHSPKVLFLVPNLHNPTTITLSEERRRQLLEVVQRHDLLIVEDDVYAPLLDSPPPAFAAMDPERTVYFTGLSKCVAPGLRAAFVVPPARLVPDVAAAIRIDCWSVAPLTCLVATRMIEDGTAREIVETHRSELKQRNEIARQILPGDELRTQPTSTHAWLELPESWRGVSFADVCQYHGVRVLASEAFTLGQAAAPHAVRINVAAARSQEDLGKALIIVQNLLLRGHLHLNNAI